MRLQRAVENRAQFSSCQWIFLTAGRCGIQTQSDGLMWPKDYSDMILCLSCSAKAWLYCLEMPISSTSAETFRTIILANPKLFRSTSLITSECQDKAT